MPIRKKQDVVKALTQLIKSETHLCKGVKKWLKIHKDDTITLEGMEVKLEAIFETKLKPISDAIDQAYKASKPLMTKMGSKVKWNIPTADDVKNLLDASDSFIEAFAALRKFGTDHVNRVPTLQSLLDILSQSALDGIRNQLDVVKKMPFY